MGEGRRKEGGRRERRDKAGRASEAWKGRQEE